jgi:signal transduction histidine kinase
MSAHPRADQAKVTLSLTAGDDLPRVWADPVRLTQLFDNLISNAVKFTSPGGTVWVGVTGTADAVHIEVTDTGMGIPAAEVERLFERFFRTSTAGAVAGTGLGLSIVKSLVEVHEGTLGVSSTEGVGTTFRVELPIRPRAQVGWSGAEPQVGVPGASGSAR